MILSIVNKKEKKSSRMSARPLHMLTRRAASHVIDMMKTLLPKCTRPFIKRQNDRVASYSG